MFRTICHVIQLTFHLLNHLSILNQILHWLYLAKFLIVAIVHAQFESVVISFPNCALFIWSEMIVFLSFLCILGSVQYHCGLTILSVVVIAILCFEIYGQTKR